ncbi:MAG: AAA family ATPase [Candidatus Pacearchaeota archaeon]|jgi:exonuclease SbcC
MLIKRLSIENIRSYTKEDIVFPRGSILLSGDIGTGKTTILLAIEFALFGLQPGQKGASLLRNGADEGKVILDFEIDDKNVSIERILKRSKKSINQEYTSLIINNEKFEESVTEIKSKILKILNYPLEFAKKTNLLYKFTVYTPQEEMKQIILESGDTRLNTLRYVFGIDKYKRIEENSSLLASKLREKIRINEGMIYNLEDIKENLEKKKKNLLDLKDKQHSLSDEYKKSIEVRVEIEQKINELQEKINEKRAIENERSKSLVLISEKNQQLISMNNTIKSIEQQIEESKKISFVQSEYDSLIQDIQFQEKKEEELQKEYIKIVSKINSEDSRKNEIMNLKNKITGLQKCPTCLQEVSDEYKTNIFSRTNEELDKSEKEIIVLLTLRRKFSDELESSKKLKEELRKKSSAMELLKVRLENQKEKEERIKDLVRQKQSLEKDLEILKKHVNTLEQSINDFSKYDSIFETGNIELKKAKQNENSIAIKIAENNKEIQFLDIQIKEKISEIESKEQIKKKTERMREMEYWISEKFLDFVLYTEKQVMLTLKEEFSRLFSKWFSMLVSDSLSAKLDDSFSPVIEQQDYELDYAFLSGGERTAIALAYRLSLNQVINSLLSNIKTGNLVILDEPTDGFSAQQLDKMRDVLNQLDVEQLIIVSHEQKIEGFVDNIIRISKDTGITKIDS